MIAFFFLAKFPPQQETLDKHVLVLAGGTKQDSATIYSWEDPKGQETCVSLENGTQWWRSLQD